MEDFIISGGYYMPYLTNRLRKAEVVEKISIEGADEFLWSYLEKGKLYHFTVLKSVFLNLKHGNMNEGRVTIPDGVWETLQKMHTDETVKKDFIFKVVLSYNINRMTGITHSQVRDILKDLEKDGLQLRPGDWVNKYLCNKSEV